MSDPGGSPAETYIDLARLGRLDAWSVTKAIARILLYPVLFVFLAVLVGSAVPVFLPGWAVGAQHLYEAGGPAAELALVLISFLPVTWAVRDAVVKSQRRPFLSLIGPDLRFDWRRFFLGAGIWLAAILLMGGVQALLAPVLPLSDEPIGTPVLRLVPRAGRPGRLAGDPDPGRDRGAAVPRLADPAARPGGPQPDRARAAGRGGLLAAARAEQRHQLRLFHDRVACLLGAQPARRAARAGDRRACHAESVRAAGGEPADG
ncbi:MAG: hypothetical protein WDN69_36550 [Aliidongia sp.]